VWSGWRGAACGQPLIARRAQLSGGGAPGRLQRIGAALILFMLSVAVAASIARLGVTPDREMAIRYSIFVAAGQIGTSRVISDLFVAI
jgi:hypothetical protein